MKTLAALLRRLLRRTPPAAQARDQAEETVFWSLVQRRDG